MKITANEELFNEWKHIATRIDCMKSIVQNDMEVPPWQVAEWHNLAIELQNCLEDLSQRTYTYIMENAKK